MSEKAAKPSSMWSRFLEGALVTKLERPGNVFLLGPPQSGKRALLRALEEHLRQPGAPRPDAAAEPERVHLLDFRYLSVQCGRDEDAEELGKLNVHVVDRVCEALPELLTPQMLSNLLLVVNLDLSRPAQLEEQFTGMCAFGRRALGRVLAECEPGLQAALRAALEEVVRRIAEIGRRQADEEAPRAAAQPQHEGSSPGEAGDAAEPQIAESMLEGPAPEPDPALAQSTAASDLLISEATPPAAPVAPIAPAGPPLPLLILANKSSQLASFENEAVFTHVIHTLRRLAIAEGASLLCVDGPAQTNLDALLDFLAEALLDRRTEPPRPASFLPTSLFCAAGADSPARLAADFPAFAPFAFPAARADDAAQRRPVEEVKPVQAFYADLSQRRFDTLREEAPAAPAFRASQVLAVKPGLARPQKPVSITERMRALLEKKAGS